MKTVKDFLNLSNTNGEEISIAYKCDQDLNTWQIKGENGETNHFNHTKFFSEEMNILDKKVIAFEVLLVLESDEQR